MKPSEIRTELTREHEGLRKMIDGLRILAGKIQVGDPLDIAMREGLARLGEALAVHNQREESLLKDLIPTVDAWGSVRAEVMNSSHRLEHDELEAMVMALRSGPIRFLDLMNLFERLLEHMAREERDILGEDVLRDDSVVVEASS
jgi:hypothetical protein